VPFGSGAAAPAEQFDELDSLTEPPLLEGSELDASLVV
jgi:hypothetical protein